MGILRSYLFTERERALLVGWVERGEEGQATRDLFSKIRRNMWPLSADYQLMMRVIRLLQKEHRFHARMTRGLIKSVGRKGR